MSVSLYNDPPPTTSEIELELSKLKVFFPALRVEFVSMLTPMIRKDAFTKQRLQDAVDNVIRTCKYPTPTASSILGYDKRLKLYRHNEVCKMIGEGYSFDDFEKVKTDGKILWTLKNNQL